MDFSFSDIENVDWETIKSTLSSSDSWSICRLGDYFAKSVKNKRRRSNEKLNHKEKIMKNTKHNDNMITNSDSSTSSTDDFDMVDDIYKNRPLFRLMPQISSTSNNTVQPIVEPG